jgi:simple sugar transport system ATP-binding protein
VPRVELRDVHKRFGDTVALDGAELTLAPGEVHALLGENGAGKTTLMRVLYGLVQPDAGEIRLDGVPVAISGPRHALALGIGLVHQHFMGVPALSVAENLVLGEPGSVLLGRSELRREARARLARHGLDLDPDLPAERLSVAEQQRLEIARLLERGADVLVFDEPTAVLAPIEVEALLALLAGLRDEGRCVVFISHKLEEIGAVCDRVTVLRHGRSVVTRPVAGLTPEALGRWMVGSEPPPPGRPPETEPGDVALRLHRLRAGRLRGIDLEVRGGEICAVAGIDGNGQGDLEEVLARVRPLESGLLEVLDPPLAVLSGDRQRTGLVLGLDLGENLVLAEAARGGAPPVFRRGLLRPRALAHEARVALARFAIRGRPDVPARTLSGGNQQKLCVARALRARPRVLVAVNPTRGLDVVSTAAVREELRAQAQGGGAVLLVSTDLEEVLALGTRIAVLFRGRLTTLEPERCTRARIGELMLGEGAA